MGIQGLLQSLRPIERSINISEYKGKTVAIDGHCLLRRECFGAATNLALNNPTESYLDDFMHYIGLLQDHAVIPIVVFDGLSLPLKQNLDDERRQFREKDLKKGRALYEQGKVAQAEELFQKAVTITDEMIEAIIRKLISKGVQCIVAPNEANAQLVHLVKTGKAEAVLTEDSNILAFGCNKCIYRIDRYGNGVELSLSQILHNDASVFRGFDAEKMRHVCILSGCDYLPSLKGFDLKTVLERYDCNKSTHLAIIHLRSRHRRLFPDDYIEKFYLANLGFSCQWVYDIDQKDYVRLNPLPYECSPHHILLLGRIPTIQDSTMYRVNPVIPKMTTNETIETESISDSVKENILVSRIASSYLALSKSCKKSLKKTGLLSKLPLTSRKSPSPIMKAKNASPWTERMLPQRALRIPGISPIIKPVAPMPALNISRDAAKKMKEQEPTAIKPTAVEPAAIKSPQRTNLTENRFFSLLRRFTHRDSSSKVSVAPLDIPGFSSTIKPVAPMHTHNILRDDAEKMKEQEPTAIETTAIEPTAIESAAIESAAIEPTAIEPAAIKAIAIKPSDIKSAPIKPVQSTNLSENRVSSLRRRFTQGDSSSRVPVAPSEMSAHYVALYEDWMANRRLKQLHVQPKKTVLSVTSKQSPSPIRKIKNAGPLIQIRSPQSTIRIPDVSPTMKPVAPMPALNYLRDAAKKTKEQEPTSSLQNARFNALHMASGVLPKNKPQPVTIKPTAMEPVAITPTASESASIEPAAIEPAAIEPAAIEPVQSTNLSENRVSSLRRRFTQGDSSSRVPVAPSDMSAYYVALYEDWIADQRLKQLHVQPKKTVLSVTSKQSPSPIRKPKNAGPLIKLRSSQSTLRIPGVSRTIKHTAIEPTTTKPMKSKNRPENRISSLRRCFTDRDSSSRVPVTPSDISAHCIAQRQDWMAEQRLGQLHVQHAANTKEHIRRAQDSKKHQKAIAREQMTAQDSSSPAPSPLSVASSSAPSSSGGSSSTAQTTQLARRPYSLSSAPTSSSTGSSSSATQHWYSVRPPAQTPRLARPLYPTGTETPSSLSIINPRENASYQHNTPAPITSTTSTSSTTRTLLTIRTSSTTRTSSTATATATPSTPSPPSPSGRKRSFDDFNDHQSDQLSGSTKHLRHLR